MKLGGHHAQVRRATMNNFLWFGAGTAVGVAAALLIPALWRSANADRRGTLLRYGLPLGAALLFVLCMMAFSHLRGTAPAPSPATAGSDMAASHAGAIEEYVRRVGQDPRDAASWLMLANLYRQQRQFGPARDAFAKLVGLNAMTADAWADYADVEASVSGSLSGNAEKFIDQALALDPAHTKALWLKASLAHEQGKETQALAVWKRLLALLPPDSSDARLVQNNIAEAEHLAGGK
jgi:tetratricopeptide (TPR) repeat protein